MEASRTRPSGGGGSPLAPRHQPTRRDRLTHRALPVGLIAMAAFVGGAVTGALHVSEERRVAERFGEAWGRGDFTTMHSLLSDAARTATPLPRFVDAYREAAATATAVSLRTGPVGDVRDGRVPLPVRVRTRIFGVVAGTVELPFEAEDEEPRIAWRPELTFPGVPPGQQLRRDSRLAPRASILARDGQRLAAGEERSSPIPGVAAQVVGELGAIPAERRHELRSRGYPDGARVGLSGLELSFQERLAGTPGGTLFAGGRVVGRAAPRPGRAVKTTIDPELEETAIGALAGTNGAVAVLRPASGEVLALAGPAFSGLSPPGSTFKVITTTAALEEGKVRLDEVFPVETGAILSGVRLANAGDESCGGSFENSFAHSCNSVFAPLGVRVGPGRLVEEAEEYGFNRPPGIPGAGMSSLPAGDQIGDDLAVGATAIGQGKVLSSALQMASVAATIANRGVRAQPTLELGQRSARQRVTSPEIAATIRSLMVGVVKNGTGTAADLADITVAGKTGTAELGAGPGGTNVEGETDAWFIAFAPARAPRLAVAVVRYRAGAGGAAAAPVAAQILDAAL